LSLSWTEKQITIHQLTILYVKTCLYFQCYWPHVNSYSEPLHVTKSIIIQNINASGKLNMTLYNINHIQSWIYNFLLEWQRHWKWKTTGTITPSFRYKIYFISTENLTHFCTKYWYMLEWMATVPVMVIVIHDWLN
jgi:hypothetical protein